MTEINTVTGKIDSSELGCTLIHEHLRSRSEEVAVQFPRLYDEEFETSEAISQLNEVKARGVNTVCDPTVMGLGRDVLFMERISRETGVQVIAATGIYTYHYIAPHFQNRDIDYMADQFVQDIEVGVQNTSIKAGFLKCATDRQGMQKDVEKVIRGVARAHLRTGVPIMTHSHPASGTGLMQLDILEEEGVNLENVLIGHCGDTTDIEYILRVLDRGAYIGMDRYGIKTRLSTEDRNATVIELVRRGYADRMFLSQDSCCTIDWFPPEVKKASNPDWTMTFVVDEVIPQLKRAGVSDEHIHTMMYENVQRWFAGK
ncbi:phosphotriesterase family protein [Bacillus dakarensis]|uniref:phosphotriesterase family protein n=1 Tax=Robertmurraya dakarensis TaxID=1926278 RepID=UPI00098205F4|nr:phosphotriesterase [Bacillus dakarensis]